MLTSKQRAYLRSLAANEDTILQIGKGGIGDNLITQVNDALAARELIKVKVLDSAMLYPEEAARTLAEAVGAEVVQTMGSKLTLYKRNPKNQKIFLPKQKSKV